MDSNLFKEAIADAKAVRQTALANAKVALEEAFTERYKAMFAEKLKEEAEQEETVVPGEVKGADEENVSETEIDELIKELEAEVGEPPQAETGNTEPPADDAATSDVPPTGAPVGMPPVGGAPTICPPGAIPCPGAPGGQILPPAGAPPVGGEMPPMGSPVGTPPVGGPPVGTPPVGGELPPTPAAGSPPPSDEPAASGEEEDEEFDLNELLESLKEEIEEGDKEEEEKDETKKLDEATKLASSGIGGGKAGGSANKQPAGAAKSSSKIESGGIKQEGVPSVDSTKVGPADATKASRPNEGSHVTKDNQSTPSLTKGGDKGGGSGGKGIKGAGVPSVDSTKEQNPDSVSRPNMGKNATKDNQSTPGGMLEENQALKRQLNEAEEVIRYVKGQLNEVNLLNAKLLFTNKLFKEFNMNNEQKMRIVEMFDLAKNVREVKLTYANIAESLNFGGSDIKRKAKTSSSVQSITEGLASGAVGSTKPSSNKQIITEASNMASRFQKLAGIKKPSK